MYLEFKSLALEDAQAGFRYCEDLYHFFKVTGLSKYFLLLNRYGLECLFRFYSYGLEKKFRANVFADFQHLTLQDHNAGYLYGLEKFWAFLKYSKVL